MRRPEVPWRSRRHHELECLGLARPIIDGSSESLRACVEGPNPVGVLDDRVDRNPLRARRVPLRVAVKEQLDDPLLGPLA